MCARAHNGMAAAAAPDVDMAEDAPPALTAELQAACCAMGRVWLAAAHEAVAAATHEAVTADTSFDVQSMTFMLGLGTNVSACTEVHAQLFNQAIADDVVVEDVELNAEQLARLMRFKDDTVQGCCFGEKCVMHGFEREGCAMSAIAHAHEDMAAPVLLNNRQCFACYLHGATNTLPVWMMTVGTAATELPKYRPRIRMDAAFLNSCKPNTTVCGLPLMHRALWAPDSESGTRLAWRGAGFQ